MRLALALLAVAIAPVEAQDSFGGPPAAPAQPAQPVPPRPPQPGDERAAAGERQDFGVAPTGQLHAGAMHGPTPASIPGGRVITTPELVALLGNPQAGALVFDILGGPEALPGARPAVPAAQGGSFTDRTQQEFGNYLQQVTQGNKATPLVFYCLSTQCWMSYNASLRAINMGYQNVLWYRGGIEAWKAAGRPVEPAGQGR